MSKIENADIKDSEDTKCIEKTHKDNTLCPVCHKPTVDGFAPFCSKRCADIDLNRWLKGVYAIPMEEQDEEDAKVLINLANEEKDKE